MSFENVDTAAINDEVLPWLPFAPYSDEVFVKYFKRDTIRGETITLLKAPAGSPSQRLFRAGHQVFRCAGDR